MNTAAKALASAFRKPTPLLLGLLLVLLSLLVYWPAMRAGYVWDDDRYLTGNAHVKAPDGLSRIWFGASLPDYYPVTYTSFWAEWRLWRTSAAGYHVTNVLLHGINAVLLWRLLRRLGLAGAWLCALLFAVHPLNVESVAWISQRKNLLAVLFLLLSCQGLLRWIKGGGFASCALSLLCFAASLLAKPVAACFPAVIALYAWGQPRENARRALAACVPFFALAALDGAVTVVFQQAHSLQGEAVGPDGIWRQLLTASRALVFYAQKAYWPSGLCSVYPLWTVTRFWLPGLVSGAALGLFAVLLFLRRSTWGRPALFALSYYVAMLFPVLGFFDVGFMFYSMVADHWAYAAVPALLALPAAAPAWAARRSATCGRTATATACAVAAILAVLTFCQAAIYRSPRTLFLDTVARNPRAWVAHVCLGNLAFSRGDLAAAEECYRKALQCRPDYWEAQNGMGIVFASRGRTDVAIELFRAVLARKPEHASARRNLRIALRQERERQAASPSRE